MSEQVQQNLKVNDQGDEKIAQKTPEAVKDGGVIAAQPNQEVHSQAFAQAHANDKTLSEPDMIAIEVGETVAEHKARVAQIQANRLRFIDSGKENRDDTSTFAGKPKVHEHPAKQAVEPMPSLTPILSKGPYNSSVKLNVQITNVPEVSEGVKAEEVLQHLNQVFETGAQAVRPIKEWMATQNAVSDALIGIGPALDSSVSYYGNTPANQVARDARAALTTAGEALGSTLDHLLTPDERAKAAGTMMPLFFFEGPEKEPVQLETAQQLGLEGLTQSELSELGILRITRRAGAGGDWPVLNERFSPDVVHQATREGCVAAVGEMLSEGRFNQSELFPEVQTMPHILAERLGSEWRCDFVADKETAFAELARRGKPWSAELKDVFAGRIKMGHMVIVDGMDEAGNVMIRDPQDATRYEMNREDFIEYWTRRAIWR